MKAEDSLPKSQPEKPFEEQADVPHENRIDIRAEDRSQVNAVGSINHAKSVHVGNRYEIPCTLPPPVVEHITYTPDNRDLALWIERDQIQETLCQRIEDAQTLMVEIIAAGGFGKSSLAVWLCEQAEARGKKVIWVGFSSASRFSAFARWVLYKLCVPTDDTMSEAFLTQQLVHHLREHPCLVVLDQIEFIAETTEKPFFEAFLVAWQGKGRKSQVLVTTRQRFVGHEQLCLQLPGFTAEEGSAFLQKRDIISDLSDGLPNLSEICGGHPLLLNLSATWLEKTEDKRLDQAGLEFFEKLLKQDFGNPEAQVEEIFELLLDKLPSQLKFLLLEASVYRLPFDLAQSQTMQPDVTAEGLATLETQGFLLGQEDWWRLHPLVNELVIEVREAEGATTEAHRKAITYFENQLRSETTNVQDYLECFHHYCKVQDYTTAFETLGCCYSWLSLRGYYRILVDAYERLVQAWQTTTSDNYEEKEKLGESLNRLGVAFQSLGEYREAIYYQQQSLEIDREIGDCKGEASSLCNLGSVYGALGEYRKAIYYQQQSLEIQRKIGDRKGEAGSLGNLGNVYGLLGKYREAIYYQQQSLEIDREIGDCKGEANSLGNLGNAYQSLGEYHQAIYYQQQSLEIQRNIGNREGEANSLGNLGIAYRSLEEYHQANDYQQQSLDIQHEIGDRNGEALSLLHLGITYEKMDEHWKAKEKFEQAQKLFTELQLPHMIEKCEAAIQERNLIIARIPKKAPPLPTKTTESDWREKSMPMAMAAESLTSRSALPKWLLYVALAAVIIIVILFLQ